MSTEPAEGRSITIDATRAWWRERQRAVLDELEETHDFGFCLLHGFWLRGPKTGAPVVAPACPFDLEPPIHRGENIIYDGIVCTGML